METLINNCILVFPKVSIWTGRKHDRNATKSTLRHYKAKQDVGRFHKDLVNHGRIRRLHRCATNLRQFHYENTLPYPDEGWRILPLKNFQKYMAEIAMLADDFKQEVEKFLSDYEGLIQQAKSELGRMFDESDYPTVERVRNKFDFSLSQKTVPADSDYNRLVIDEGLRDTLKKQAVEDANKVHKRAMNDLFNRLAERVSICRDNLSDGKRIHTSLIGNVKDVLKLIPVLNYDNNSKVNGLCRIVDEKLGNTDVEMLKTDPRYGAETIKKAQEVLDIIKSMKYV